MATQQAKTINEIRRELKQRGGVYPRLIDQGKLHRDRANAQYKLLRDAERVIGMLTPHQFDDLLKRAKESEAASKVRQGSLFNHAKTHANNE